MADPALPVRLSDEAITAALAHDLPKWRLEAGHLTRTYRTAGWKGTLMVVNTIGHLAEAAWHHPDLSVHYSKVKVSLTTHDAGGISGLDVALARKIESVVLWRPGAEDGGLPGTPDAPDAAYILYD